jgi:HK97 family phage major capsid protein
MSIQEIKSAVDQMASAFEEFKSVNDARIKAVEKGDTSKAAELTAKLARIEADVAKYSELKSRLEKELEIQRERIEELEAAANRPGKTATDKKRAEYNEAFEAWVRKGGNSPEHEAKMRSLESVLVDKKDIATTSSAAGGFGVPKQIASEIERLERLFSPVRDLVRVVPVGTSDYRQLVSVGGADAGWVGETDSRTSTATSELREITPTQGELYAYPQASEWSLDDIFFDVEAWLSEEVAQVFAQETGRAVISGNGTKKPTGMLNSTPTDVGDHPVSRAAAVYQYVDGGALIDADGLIDLVYTLNSMYRPGSSFVANSVTIGAIRKLKDADGQYLWSPSLAVGQPDSLLGYPVRAWEDLQGLGEGAFPVAFGNFRRGYVLVDRVGLRITRDNISAPGFIRFYVRRRLGGHVLNNDAIKFLRTSGVST